MLDHDRIDATHTWVVYEGPPFADPLLQRPGPLVAACAAMSDAELEELCGHWEWRAGVATEEIDRWWSWTVVRFGQRLLAGRRAAQWREQAS
ncbi:hypothetical protein GCM10009867_08050 [Pedococcus aerophilus]|uniref:Uncharacterized protein n=1 Tax=Pedococcus aerophilus TaxID=436356 RepID=A0ABN3UGL4_9MICO